MNKQTIDLINEIIATGKNQGLLQLYTEDKAYNGRIITFKGKPFINFGSCSYLGLEIDQRLKNAAINAIERYGTQYSSSRSYVSCTLYRELENLMQEMFKSPIVISPTTTLGHQATIPIVVEEGDAIILDQQVHASVREAALQMKLRGIPVVVTRHNRLDELEKKIEALSVKNKRIWYMGDGVYSMYGDCAPVKDLIELLNKYKRLYLYLDDAHGMSWAGDHGTGYVLSQIKQVHSKMILATSLNKAFSAGGGVIVFPNQEWCDKVRNCGGPLMFSGPIQIPSLGAAIASAKIHLSDEIIELQQQLMKKIRYCHELLINHNLPVVSYPNTPIFFIGLGLKRIGDKVVKRIINDGYYVNLSIFPAVSETCTGVRFTINRHHTYEDIEKLTSSIAYHLPRVLAEEKRTIIDIQRAFRNVKDFSYISNEAMNTAFDMPNIITPKFHLQQTTSIHNISPEMWNKLLGDDVSYDWNGLAFLEKAFSNNKYEEHNWNFNYYVIRDKSYTPVLATFFTQGLVKDDMLENANISKEIEWTRINDPYYLCSSALMMGTQLSTGKHLFIDRSNSSWKDSFMMLLDELWQKQERKNINMLNLRDFDASDEQISAFLGDQGFIKVNIPAGHVIQGANVDEQAYLSNLKSDRRHYIKNKVLSYESHYDVEVLQDMSTDEALHYYQLYKNVANKNFEINSFHLPESFFTKIINQEGWEIISLQLKPDYDKRQKSLPVGMAVCYKTKYNYYFLLAGLDYMYVEQYNVYAQLLWQIVKRGSMLNLNRVDLGLTTSQNKRKFGAQVCPYVAYVQIQDKYNQNVIDTMFKQDRTALKI